MVDMRLKFLLRNVKNHTIQFPGHSFPEICLKGIKKRKKDIVTLYGQQKPKKRGSKRVKIEFLKPGCRKITLILHETMI